MKLSPKPFSIQMVRLVRLITRKKYEGIPLNQNISSTDSVLFGKLVDASWYGWFGGWNKHALSFTSFKLEAVMVLLTLRTHREGPIDILEFLCKYNLLWNIAQSVQILYKRKKRNLLKKA